MILKIITYNIHKGVGWGIKRSTLDLIQQQISMLNPDFAFLQEIRGSQFASIANEQWSHYCYGKNAVYAKGHHGNAILSKHPIVFSDNIDLSMHRFEHRGMLHAAIQLPHHQSLLHLVCLHLGLFKSDRKKQLAKVIDYIEKNIPPTNPLILGGDFNDWSNLATIPLINYLGMEEAHNKAHQSYAKTFPAWAPLLKLDRLYYRGFQHINTQRLTNKHWKYLSDHIALEAILEPRFK